MIHTREPDGLALEYQRYYGTARGNIKIANLVNNPAVSSEIRVLSLGLPEEFWNQRLVNFGSLFEDSSDPFVIPGNIL